MHSIEFLHNQIAKNDPLMPPPELWVEWDSSDVTKYLTHYIKEILLEDIIRVTQGSHDDQFYRGRIEALDHILNVIQENKEND